MKLFFILLSVFLKYYSYQFSNYSNNCFSTMQNNVLSAYFLVNKPSGKAADNTILTDLCIHQSGLQWIFLCGHFLPWTHYSELFCKKKHTVNWYNLFCITPEVYITKHKAQKAMQHWKKSIMFHLLLMLVVNSLFCCFVTSCR